MNYKNNIANPVITYRLTKSGFSPQTDEFKLESPASIDFGSVIMNGLQKQVIDSDLEGILQIKAFSGNARDVYIGKSGGLANGYPLFPSDEIYMQIKNVGQIFVSGSNLDKINYIVNYI